ncbi:MAG: glycosyltransferase family 4 protein [Candidatus Peribacteraceae bacterium]|nr:glycosyltransferase family 4 protein [Candidatus Peribacteraceae bacterium]
MKIIVDLRALAGDQISGVKIYLTNLLSEIFRLDKKNRYFLWFNSATENFPKLAVPHSPRFKKIHTRFSNRILNLKLGFSSSPPLDELILSTEDRREKIDLFWLPDPRPVALSSDCRLVATIHDLSPVRFPRFFSSKTRLWHRFLNPHRIAKSADRIIAVSDFTKSELEKYWAIPKAKISVTPLAAKLSTKRVLPKNLPKRFILALSTLEPRKNLKTLVHAFQEYRQENPDSAELVLAGDFDRKIFADPGIMKHEAGNMKHETSSMQQGVHFLGKVSETEKAALFSAAEVFCFPSIYEGFGLPPLEAAAAGTPVLAADIPPLREVLGNAAKFIPPNNVDAWRIALVKILSDKKLQKKMSAAGKRRASEFSWEKTAQKTLAAFEDAVK